MGSITFSLVLIALLLGIFVNRNHLHENAHDIEGIEYNRVMKAENFGLFPPNME